MVAVALPREGARSGGVTTDGFAVCCRADQDCTFTVKVYTDKARVNEASGYSSTSASVTSATHWFGTVYVTGLQEGRRYWWAVNFDNAVDAATVGTEATFTAGSVKTLSSSVRAWKAAVLGCFPWHPMKADPGAEMYMRAHDVLLSKDLDFCIHQDDVYYPDIQGDFPTVPTAYAAGEFFDPATHADASIAKFRTNFISTYSALDNPGALLASAGNGGFRTSTLRNTMAEFKCQVPHIYMWGDHDRAFDDCTDRANAIGDELQRWNDGRDSGHEMFMALNKAYVDQENAWTAYSSEHHWFYVDVPPVRFIVMDTVTDGDDKLTADSTSKSKLGASQKADIKNWIEFNTQKYLVVLSGNMIDGNHGWNGTTSNWYDWTGYTYERDEILDHIREKGNASRTVIICGDTHEGGVYADTGLNGIADPIWCVLSGSVGWNPSLHLQINGFKGGATGRGCVNKQVFGQGSWAACVESRKGQMVVTLECLDHDADPGGGGMAKGIHFRKVFK